MTKHEKKQVKEIIEKLKKAQSDISSMVMQEQDRLDTIGDGISQIDRAMKLEDNIDNLEKAEEELDDVIITLEEIL